MFLASGGSGSEKLARLSHRLRFEKTWTLYILLLRSFFKVKIPEPSHHRGYY